MDSPTEIHVCEDAVPPDKWSKHVTYNLKDIRPTCVKILDADDHVKNLTAYDAELYTGTNDGDQHHLTNITVNDPEDISTTDLYTTINLAQLSDKTKQTFNMDDIDQNTSITKILSIKMDLQQQMDSGANKNVTNDRRIIRNCSKITPIPIFGIGTDDAACHITEKGVTTLETTDGTDIDIIMYFSRNCSGTIISPNAIVRDNQTFTSWTQTSHLDTGSATICFYHRTDFTKNKTLLMHMRNDLWYLNQSYKNMIHAANKLQMCILQDDTAISPFLIHKLDKSTEYELWHQRLLHPGHTAMDQIDKCTTGIPHLHRHPMHKCSICHEMNITKTSSKSKPKTPTTKFAEQFQMDFGFMSAREGKELIRSHDGYNCYLLIVDLFTRYLWIFLSKNKHPPLQTVKQFLRTYGLKKGVRIIRTDQGGELARSTLFRNVLQDAGYSIEVTGADNSSQNGIAERPHRTLANMVRTALENAALPYKYWSDALLHAAFVRNRLPHAHFQNKTTPYEKLTGMKPDLTKLRVFGSRIVTRKPGHRHPKISKHSYSGIFLRYAKTMKNIVYLDTNSKKIKTTTYAKFDEAHFSYANKPPGAQILINLGLKSTMNKDTPANDPPTLQIVRRHPKAIVPKQGSDKAAGYDLYSITDCIIPPNSVSIIDTGIAAQFPSNTYGRIASRSGLALHHNVEIKGGVIDPDYVGNIKIILHNFGHKDFHVKESDRVAQLIIEQYLSPHVKVSTKIPPTIRNKKGFGSTGISDSSTVRDTPSHQVPFTPDEIEKPSIVHSSSTTDTTLVGATIDMVFNKPVNTTTVQIRRIGDHPTLGLELKNDDKGPIITHCKRGTPAAKISKWRQILKGAILYSVDNFEIYNDVDIKKIIKKSTNSHVTIRVIPPTPTDIHPDTGLPQLNFDQFVHLASCHQQILTDEKVFYPAKEIDQPHSLTVINKMNAQNLTRKQLMNQTDWKDWEASEWLQLDQYQRQNMFSSPGPLPTNLEEYSILPMIWVYLVKTDGRKKARCVANGAPHLKGTITLANTYAACLEQAACRLFWAIAAIKNKLVFGSDAVNAFAEAPPPKSPLFLKVDAAYRNWYNHKHGIQLSDNSYVRVLQAIQGHPESPRLWNLHIDSILSKMGYTPITHEPCIYIKFTNTETIYLLRQVDDFVIACDDKRTATDCWNEMDTYLKEPLKRESGLIKRHNGIDIVQSKDSIKMHCGTYLTKILQSKTFDMTTVKHKPLPMESDNKYILSLESEVGPKENDAQKELEQSQGFKYRNATGELIFAMITCRADIAFPVIKLTQYNSQPACVHFTAVKKVFTYLNATIDDGLIFWQPRPHRTLPYASQPLPADDTHKLFIPPESESSTVAYGYTDSDLAGDTKTRKSVSGVTIIFGGAAAVYKTILQRTIALSSTEAEFYALTEAGKLVLYVRHVLKDLHLEQTEPTTIYEDNRGCLQMTKALKPTKRTRHVDSRFFAILDWVQTDQILVKKVDTADNASDVLTKPTGRIIFYWHNDTLLGKRTPKYVQVHS